jgi:hypothetical protein
MSLPIDSDMLVSITVDELLDVIIVKNYLEITGKGMERAPKLYAVDIDWCVSKLKHVQDKVIERHVGAKNVPK